MTVFYHSFHSLSRVTNVTLWSLSQKIMPKNKNHQI
jgi:hypothetical protein